MLHMTYNAARHPISQLAHFIVTYYVTQWFALCLKWRATEAPEVLFSGYKALLSLPTREKGVVMLAVKCAYYWCHPKQLLLAGPETASVGP